MKPSDVVFSVMGCCNEHKRGIVDVDDGTQAIVTDNGDGTYSVVRFKNGLMLHGSAKTITAEDDV